MCIATIIGFIFLPVALMVGIGNAFPAMIDPPCVIIVLGGTMAALFISFPLKDMIDLPLNCLGYAIVPPKERNATVDYRLSSACQFGPNSPGFRRNSLHQSSVSRYLDWRLPE